MFAVGFCGAGLDARGARVRQYRSMNDDRIDLLDAIQARNDATVERVMAQRLGVSVPTLHDIAFLAYGRRYVDERCERTWALIDAWHALLEDEASDVDLDAVAEAAFDEVVDAMHVELAAVAEV